MNYSEIIGKLSFSEPASLTDLYAEANEKKVSTIGNKVYLRGLIEFSNICSKNCYYCGICRENQVVNRYELTDQEVLFCMEKPLRFGSTAIGRTAIGALYQTYYPFVGTKSALCRYNYRLQ